MITANAVLRFYPILLTFKLMNLSDHCPITVNVLSQYSENILLGYLESLEQINQSEQP